MANTGFFHHIGSFLLFVATILLLITCISAPVVHDIGIMKVDLNTRNNGPQSTVSFGTFGWCLTNRPGMSDECSPSHLGYSPANVVSRVMNTDWPQYADESAQRMTKAMILHPIACGLNFIAFLLGVSSGIVGSFLASMVALLAFLITCAIVIIDFVLFSVVRVNIRDDRDINGGNYDIDAHYSTAAWTILVAGICSLIGTVILFFTCCSSRMHRQRRSYADKPVTDGYAPPARRRRWF
jgi:hypothetical protein